MSNYFWLVRHIFLQNGGNRKISPTLRPVPSLYTSRSIPRLSHRLIRSATDSYASYYRHIGASLTMARSHRSARCSAWCRNGRSSTYRKSLHQVALAIEPRRRIMVSSFARVGRAGKRGVKAGAVYSVIETAEFNGINSQAYTADVILRIASDWPISGWHRPMSGTWKPERPSRYYAFASPGLVID